MSRGFWLGLATVLLAAALGVWWYQTFELREVRQRLPLSGEARFNPLFGLGEVLKARGHAVESLGQLQPKALPKQRPALLVLHADLRTVSTASSQLLLDWVDGGGELVVGLPDGDSPLPGSSRAPLLDLLGLDTTYHYDCIDWRYAVTPATQKAIKRATGGGEVVGDMQELWGELSGQLGARYCSSIRLDLRGLDEADFDWLYGSADNGYVFARLRHGGGRITFAAQLDFLGTRALREPANAALAWQLLSPALAEGSTVQLAYAADLPPLHVLLVRHGWPILLPLLLALLAWLWRRAQRFGPLLDEPLPRRRALREHLRAAAELALRRERGAALLKPLRQRVLNRLAVRAPELAALPALELARALAARHRLSPAAVEQALFDTRIHRPAAAAEAVRILHRLSTEP
jgi:uncharacterized protein (TIGR03382 family)